MLGVQGGWIADSLKQITGHAVQAFSATLGVNRFHTVAASFNSGNRIGFASNGSPPLSTVVGGSAYAVFGYNATTKAGMLFNPRGASDSLNKLGLITLNWTQI